MNNDIIKIDNISSALGLAPDLDGVQEPKTLWKTGR